MKQMALEETTRKHSAPRKANFGQRCDVRFRTKKSPLYQPEKNDAAKEECGSEGKRDHSEGNEPQHAKASVVREISQERGNNSHAEKGERDEEPDALGECHFVQSNVM